MPIYGLCSNLRLFVGLYIGKLFLDASETVGGCHAEEYVQMWVGISENWAWGIDMGMRFPEKKGNSRSEG